MGTISKTTRRTAIQNIITNTYSSESLFHESKLAGSEIEDIRQKKTRGLQIEERKTENIAEDSIEYNRRFYSYGKSGTVPDTASYIRRLIQMVLAPNDLFS